jgi:hypothetical protein
MAMDLERAMEFMLEQQAQMQARQTEMQVRQAEMQAWRAEAEKEHKEQIAELRGWLIRGAKTLAIHRKMLAEQREAGQETDRRISALVEAQQANEQHGQDTDKRISALVEAQQANELRVHELHDSQLATDKSLRETQASLKAFIDSMHKSGNGH